MPSLRSHALVAFLRITRRKHIYSSVGAVLEGITKVRQAGPARPSSEMSRRVKVEHQTVDGIEIYRISPHIPQPRQLNAFYLHGGAYIRPITSHHWRFIQALVEQAGCTIIVPLYPLAPEATCKGTVAAVTALYKRACTEAGVASFDVIGDSAGGGMALALCYALREDTAILPRSLVLICPWLDVTLTNPSIAPNEKNDPMLATAGLKEAGRMYAGNLGSEHCYVSPIYGDLRGLPPTLLFAGTRDIAHYDELLFAEKAKLAGVEVDLQVGQEMIHVWPILPIPESKKALRDIIKHFQTAL